MIVGARAGTEKAAGCKRDLEAARAQIETLQNSLKEAQGELQPRLNRVISALI